MDEYGGYENAAPDSGAPTAINVAKSRLGLASVGTSMTAVVLFVGLAALGMLMGGKVDPNALLAEYEATGVPPRIPGMFTFGLLFIGSLSFGVCGIILGFRGMRTDGDKKSLAILGLIVSSLVVLGLAGLVFLGDLVLRGVWRPDTW